MASNGPDSTGGPQIVFRGKKRKIYRQRAEDGTAADDDAQRKVIDGALAGPGSDAQMLTGAEDDSAGISVAEALRLRNARRAKLGGVAFSATQTPRRDDDEPDNDQEQAIALRDDAGELSQAQDAHGMSRRFAPQTGLAGELINKHMEEYVESELARRNRPAPEPSLQPGQSPAAGLQGGRHAGQTLPLVQMEPPKSKAGYPQPTMQGKLQEIDLGEEERARNIALTERARRRLEGQGEEDEEEEDPAGRAKKVRLGRDGKPWRPRNRRGSGDVKRDQMVEQFLSENRLDVYDVQAGQGSWSGAADDDGSADDRVAEEFRRDFMDAMAQRQQRKRPATNAPKTAPAKPGEEVLKGPKLGGSRNVRSQMRDLLLKEQERKRQ